MDKQKRNRIFWAFMVLIFIALALMLNNTLRRTVHITLPAENETENSDTYGPAGSDTLKVVEITPWTVQSAIKTLSRPENYRRTVSVEQIWSGGSTKTEQTVAVVEGWTKIDRNLPDGQVRHTLTDGETTYIWYNSEKKFFTGTAGEISADQEQMIPTYEDVLELPVDDIVAADYQDYSGVNCIYVETAENAQGYVLRYWVSVDTGLLVAAERMADGTCVYRMTALSLDDTGPQTSDFKLPNGNSVF